MENPINVDSEKLSTLKNRRNRAKVKLYTKLSTLSTGIRVKNTTLHKEKAERTFW